MEQQITGIIMLIVSVYSIIWGEMNDVRNNASVCSLTHTSHVTQSRTHSFAHSTPAHLLSTLVDGGCGKALVALALVAVAVAMAMAAMAAVAMAAVAMAAAAVVAT